MQPILVLSDVPVSRKLYETRTVSKLYKNSYMCALESKFKQIIFTKYGTNLKITITQSCLKILGMLLLKFEYNTYLFSIDIISFKLVSSVSVDQSFHLWQCSIWLRGSSTIARIFEFLNNFDRVFNKLLKTGTSDTINIVVTCLRLYHVTSLLHCHWWKFW